MSVGPHRVVGREINPSARGKKRTVEPKIGRRLKHSKGFIYLISYTCFTHGLIESPYLKNKQRHFPSVESGGESFNVS